MVARSIRHRLLLLLLLTACSGEEPPTAPMSGDPVFQHAGHLIVNSPADPGNGTCDAVECTLREAITAANQEPDPSEISFARKLTGPITLDGASGQLAITEDLAISGPKGGMVIQRNSADPAFRIFDIAKESGTATVLFTRLTIRGGQGAPSGGGIRNAENLTLSNSTVSDNAATRGGGISNGGDLTVVNSRVSGNRASTSGGGIVDFGGTVTLTNSTISGNQVTGTGGAGGGGIHSQGRLTLIGSTVSGNSSSTAGGGIANYAELTPEPTATLTNTTVSGNSAATVGGGIFTGSSTPQHNVYLVLVNSSVVANTAGTQGGGISHDAHPETLTNLTNSLLALNAAPSAPDVSASFCGSSVHVCGAGFNLIGVGDGAVGVSDGVNGNLVGTSSSPIDPRLGPLASNGGATQTHALKSGSRAIDAASTAESPSTDQRGLVRPQGPASDIGSYERKAS
jgi:CSLREA domain-containing protein